MDALDCHWDGFDPILLIALKSVKLLKQCPLLLLLHVEFLKGLTWVHYSFLYLFKCLPNCLTFSNANLFAYDTNLTTSVGNYPASRVTRTIKQIKF